MHLNSALLVSRFEAWATFVSDAYRIGHYVGNLNFDTSVSDLQAAFANYGAVSTARIATDPSDGVNRVPSDA